MGTNYTGNSTPTLSNAPANAWTTDAARANHVGNTYLVTGSGGTAGNVYAFEEYQAPVIKTVTGLPKPIVTITDGGGNLAVQSLKASILPVQSLNGYEYPWAGGAGKNKLADALINGQIGSTGGYSSSTSRITNADTTLNPAISHTYLAAGKYTLSVAGLDNCTAMIKQADGTITDNFASSWNNLPFTFTVSQDGYFLFTARKSNSSNISPSDYKAQVESGENATSWTPYSNLCPISGWQNVNLYRTGVNVWDEEWEQGTINSSGTPAGDINNIRAKNYISVKPSTAYYCKGNHTILVYYYDASKTFISGAVDVTNNTFTTPSNCYFIKIRTGGYGGTYNNDISINYPSTDHDYHAYNGTSLTFSLGSTVYGGYLNNDGTGKSDVYLFTGDENIICSVSSQTSDVVVFDAPLANNSMPNHATTPNAISNEFSTKIPSNTAGRMVLTGQHLYFVILKSQLSSIDQAGARAWLQSNPAQFAYKVATHTTLSLSAQDLSTLLGENNLWADCGEITELKYQSNQFIPKYDWFETWTMPKVTRNNGTVIVLPYPQEYTPEIYDVDASTTGRNAAGTMIRDRVARKHKFNYKFPPLSRADATEILGAVQDVSFTLTTASPETGAKTNYRVYVGDRSLPVYWMPTHDNVSWLYSSLSLNLIEM